MMKKIIVSLLMVLVACSALFAASDSNIVSLKNTVAAHQQILIKYGDDIVDGNDNPFLVDLKSGSAKKISLVWTGNTDNSEKQEGFNLAFAALGFKNSNATVEEEYVRVTLEGLPSTNTDFEIKDNKGNKVGSGSKAAADVHAVVKYTPEKNTYGTYTIAEFTPKWNGGYNWTAGEYSCDIEVYISAL